jgi:hypothetical protein
MSLSVGWVTAVRLETGFVDDLMTDPSDGRGWRSFRIDDIGQETLNQMRHGSQLIRILPFILRHRPALSVTQ